MKSKQLKTLFETETDLSITNLSGDKTEEELNMENTRNCLRTRRANNNIGVMCFTAKDLVVKRYHSEDDTERIEKNGAYVYSDGNESGLIFNKHNTIANALREAIKIANAKIICDGNEVYYDIIDGKTAYYVDDRIEKVKLVNI